MEGERDLQPQECPGPSWPASVLQDAWALASVLPRNHKFKHPISSISVGPESLGWMGGGGWHVEILLYPR